MGEVIAKDIDHYNNVRLNSAIGDIAAKAKPEGRVKQIFKRRDEKLEAAREAGKIIKTKTKSCRKSKVDEGHQNDLILLVNATQQIFRFQLKLNVSSFLLFLLSDKILRRSSPYRGCIRLSYASYITD